MGIRKHFESMKDEKEAMKLSDFSLEDEEKEDMRFDPEKDISNEEWQKMKEYLDEIGPDEQDYYKYAAYMRLLFPERFSELGIDDRLWDRMVGAYNSIRPSTVLLEMLTCAKILFPDRQILEDPNYDEKKKQMLSVLREDRNFDFQSHSIVDYYIIAENIVAKMICDTQERDDFPSLNDDVFEDLKKAWKGAYKKKEWIWCIHVGSDIKILFPEKFSELGVDDEFWRQAKEEIGHELKDVERLVKMKILAADKVEVTDQGLEIEMLKKSLTEKKTSRPERKSF